VADSFRFQALNRRDFIVGAGVALLGAGRERCVAFAQSAPLDAHALLLGSPIACGRLTAVNMSAARSLPGVLAVLRVSGEDELQYVGQPLLLVVAQRPEVAAEALKLCTVPYESRPAVLTMSAALRSAYVPAKSAGAALTYERGNIEAALAEAAGGGLLKQTYRTAAEPRRPLPPSPVAVVAEPGAGGAGAGEPRELRRLAALAAQKVGRPVRLVVSPEQAALLGGGRPETIQTVTLTAGQDGRLQALLHGSLSETGMQQDHVEPCGILSPHLYHAGSVRVSHQVVRKNIGPVAALPAAGQVAGLFALESALDELAYLLRIDPLRLRVLNHAEIDEATGQPWAGKRLRECYRIGAERVGWHGPDGRTREPRERRPWESKLMGLGMASTMTLPQSGDGGSRAGFGAHFTRLAVDPASGAIEILRQVVVLDLGASSELKRLEAAAEAGVAQALGSAFAEPGQVKLPQLDVMLLESAPSGANPAPVLDAGQVRELAMAGVAAAAASAIYHATGVRCRELPIRTASLRRA